MLSFVPFFFLVILPFAVRSYIQGTLKVADALLLSAPTPIHLVRSGTIPPMMRFRLRDVEFRVPKILTPVFLDPNSIIFRQLPRTLSRTLALGAYPESRKVDMSPTGIVAWFVPEDMLRFFEEVLPASWNPARLISKAHFLTSQGIGSEIFVTDWDEKHRGYIFPLSGNTGYLGRIFPTQEPGYLEYIYFDEVPKAQFSTGDAQPDAELKRVTLRHWVDIGSFIRFLSEEAAQSNRYTGPALADALKMAAGDHNMQCEALEAGINQYFAVGSTSWLLPVTTVMENRGFFRETIRFCRAFAPNTPEGKSEATVWRQILDRTVKRILRLQLDRHLQLNALIVNAQNMGEFPLRRIKLMITLLTKEGDQVFPAEICTISTLHPGHETTVQIDFPPQFSVNSAQDIQWQVEDVEVFD